MINFKRAGTGEVHTISLTGIILKEQPPILKYVLKCNSQKHKAENSSKAEVEEEAQQLHFCSEVVFLQYVVKDNADVMRKWNNYLKGTLTGQDHCIEGKYPSY